MTGKYYFTEGDLSDCMFNADIDGRRVSFTFDYIPEKHREFYANQIFKHLTATSMVAKNIAKSDLRRKLRSLLGLEFGQ